MFRPPFLARVAAGAAVYALEETRRLPANAINFPITAISQLLQTTMHFQQFVTSLALKGDAVFDRLIQPEEQPAWATFDEDEPFGQAPSAVAGTARKSSFDLFSPADSAPDTGAEPFVAEAESVAAAVAEQPKPVESPAPATVSTAASNGRNGSVAVAEPEVIAPEAPAEPEAAAEPETAAEPEAPAVVAEPEVATRYDYANISLAQLRARLRQLTVEDLTALLAYEQQTRARAPFVTMLTNRIATVQAK
ncbi:lipid droplet-associated protein [Nocardia sp. NPDC005978]|uniref:lipid droplet-associated protein n=1 Tax=Nocardia sp. NPDC005978 TaxID=3156725 RepID=UPI0033A64F3D